MSTEYALANPHPGEFLLEDFMKPLGLTAYRIGKDIGVPANRIDQIIAGQRSITADTALRFAAYFGTSPELWINLQSHYDLMDAKRVINLDIRHAAR